MLIHGLQLYYASTFAYTFYKASNRTFTLKMGKQDLFEPPFRYVSIGLVSSIVPLVLPVLGPFIAFKILTVDPTTVRFTIEEKNDEKDDNETNM